MTNTGGTDAGEPALLLPAVLHQHLSHSPSRINRAAFDSWLWTTGTIPITHVAATWDYAVVVWHRHARRYRVLNLGYPNHPAAEYASCFINRTLGFGQRGYLPTCQTLPIETARIAGRMDAQGYPID